MKCATSTPSATSGRACTAAIARASSSGNRAPANAGAATTSAVMRMVAIVPAPAQLAHLLIDELLRAFRVTSVSANQTAGQEARFAAPAQMIDRLRPQHRRHAELRHHAPRQVAGALQIVAGAGRDLVEHHLL